MTHSKTNYKYEIVRKQVYEFRLLGILILSLLLDFFPFWSRITSSKDIQTRQTNIRNFFLFFEEIHKCIKGTRIQKRRNYDIA